MEPLNADIRERAVVATAYAPWIVRDGREEKLLELADGRYTALVRLAPGGELAFGNDPLDLFVLDGSVRGSTHIYAAGVYLRTHYATRWSSAHGATLLVKQRAEAVAARLAFDTTKFVFSPAGVSIVRIHDTPSDGVAMLHFAPGAAIGSHVHELGEEFFVLRGELCDEHGSYPQHSWVRQPAGSTHAVSSASGALLFVFSHHLAPRAPV